MVDNAHLWTINPSLFLAVEQTKFLAFETIKNELSVVRMDEDCDFDSSQIHPRSSYFRYRTVTKYVNQDGFEDFYTTYNPPLREKICFIGVECSLEEALTRALDNRFRTAMLRHPLGRYFKAPSGYAWNFHFGDMLHDPVQFGLVIPPARCEISTNQHTQAEPLEES